MMPQKAEEAPTVRRLMVDPRKIQVPDVRITSQFTPEVLEMFKESVKAMGIVEPPLCMEIDGQILVVDGLHRIQEAIANGDKRIEVVIREGGERELYLLNLATNTFRGKTKASEAMEVIRHLWQEYGMDSDEIAKRSGFTRDYIERLMIISGATDELRAALDEEQVSVAVAYELARVEDLDMQRGLLAQELLYRWPAKELRERIKTTQEIAAGKVDAPPPAGAETAPQGVTCFYCGGEYQLREIANPNTCVACSGTLVAAMAQARREAAAPGP